MTEVEFLRQIFKKFDIDDTGYLEEKEFIKLMEVLKRHAEEITCMNERVAKAVFAYYDVNCDGRISFKELCNWWMSKERFNKFFVTKKCKLLVSTHEIFKKYAPNGKTMTYTNFERLLGDLRLAHDEYTFDILDEDQDGLMNFREFIDWLKWFD